ncbi:MAG: hypothetical protein KGL68_10410 [Burkholderiales bacterium]|nr:hypothetical protein [Burkholderiales bacterium]
MRSPVRPRILAAAALGAALFGLGSAARAGEIYFSLGLPVYTSPAPVYVQPQPVYVQPQPVYVPPRPVYVTPPAGAYVGWAGPRWGGDGWRRERWEHRHWEGRRERRWHDDD